MPEFRQPGKKKHPDGVHRDRWNRPIYYIPNDEGATTKCTLCGLHVPGGPFTRMTSYIGVLDDRYNLELYGKRQVAKGIAIKEHLVLQASNALSDDPDLEKAALNKVVKEAETAAGASDKADQGTQLHETLEKIMRGEKPRIPSTYRADIEAVIAKFTEHQFTVAEGDVEINVVIDGFKPTKTSHGVGGRFDLLITMPSPCPSCGRSKRVGDFKTGTVWYHGCDDEDPCKKPSFDCPKRREFAADEFAMQLGGYAHGSRYDATTGQRLPMDDVCRCLAYVIHVPATRGHAEVYPVSVERGRVGLALAYEVWQWRQSSARLEPLAPPTPAGDVATSEPPPDDGQPVAVPDIPGLISLAADRPNVLGLWRYFAASGQWTDEHTQLAKARLAELGEPIKEKEGATT